MTVEKTNNYCTDQNLIVRYPNGAGGKFLITCLFLFDHVAHWCDEVQLGRSDHLSWFYGTWPKKISEWSIVEPNQPWNTNFYSRRYDRNNDLTELSYNQLCEQESSDYFKFCWNQGLLITDHWHKRIMPKFFQQAQIIEITLNNTSLEWYKSMCRQKLWFWNADSRTVISALDHPDYAHNQYSKNMRLFYKNDYLITGYNTYDDFFNQYLVHQPYIKPFINVEKSSDAVASIDFFDLLNFEKLNAVMETLEHHWNQRIDRDCLKKMHDFWKECSNTDNKNSV